MTAIRRYYTVSTLTGGRYHTTGDAWRAWAAAGYPGDGGAVLWEHVTTADGHQRHHLRRLQSARAPRYLVKPTPFDAVRARAIWERRGEGDKLQLTPGERAYVRDVWDQLDRSATFLDAFRTILGE